MIGLPRAVEKDMIIQGYEIPKGVGSFSQILNKLILVNIIRQLFTLSSVHLTMIPKYGQMQTSLFLRGGLVPIRVPRLTEKHTTHFQQEGAIVLENSEDILLPQYWRDC